MKIHAITDNAKAMRFLEEEAGAYFAANQRMAELKKENETRKPAIMMKVDLLGVKNEKGSVEVEAGSFKVTNQARSSVSLNAEKARKLLTKRGLLSRVEKKREEIYLDEEEIARLHSEGLLSQKEIQAMTDTTDSTALVIKEIKCK